jgi:cytoskeletal protein RodZ
VITLATFMPLWLSALIVSVVVLMAGILLIQQGQSSLQADELKPKHTVETLKENKEWAQEQLR